MEWNRQYEADKKLLAHWLARKADAQTALDTANRQIEYLTNLMLSHQIHYKPEAPGFSDYGEDY
jgi:hypothetical protein